MADEVVVEEAQQLRQQGKLVVGLASEGADIRAGAVVPGPDQKMPLRIRQAEETGDGPIRVPRPVHPAGDRIHRHVRPHALTISVGAERRRGEIRIVGQPFLLEGELVDEVGHVKIVEVLADRRAQQRAIPVLVDLRRTAQMRVLVVGEPAEQLASIMVKRDHQLVVGLGEPVQQKAARIVVLAIGVPDREQRCDGLYRRMAGASGKVGSGTDIRNAGRTDGAVRPALPDDPVDDLAVVVALLRRTEAFAHTEGCSGPPHVDHDDGIAARYKEIAVAAGGDARLGGFRRVGSQGEAPVVWRENRNRRQAVPRSSHRRVRRGR